MLVVFHFEVLCGHFIFVYLSQFSKHCREERALRKAEMEAAKVFRHIATELVNRIIVLAVLLVIYSYIVLVFC